MTPTLAQSEMTQGFMLTLVGMGVVFLALITLMLLIGGLIWLSGRMDRKPKPKPAPAAASPAAATPAAPATPSDEPGEELIAVLAAAAAAALGRPVGTVRLVRFRRASDDWQAGGRRALTTAHRPASHPTRKLRS
ncbi:MAG: OadG family protein [Planctomycetota bacterium]